MTASYAPLLQNIRCKNNPKWALHQKKGRSAVRRSHLKMLSVILFDLVRRGRGGGSAFGRSPPLPPSKGRSYREFFSGPEQVLKLLQGAGPCGSHGQWPLEFQSFHISSWRREKSPSHTGRKERRKKKKKEESPPPPTVGLKTRNPPNCSSIRSLATRHFWVVIP